MADLTASGTKFTSMQCQPRLMRGQGTTNTRADHSGGSLLRGGHRQLTCQLRAEQIRCEQTDGRTCWPRVYIGRFHAGPMENGFPMPDPNSPGGERPGLPPALLRKRCLSSCLNAAAVDPRSQAHAALRCPSLSLLGPSCCEAHGSLGDQVWRWLSAEGAENRHFAFCDAMKLFTKRGVTV